MKQRMFFIVMVAFVAISCSTGTANLRIQKAAEINHKKLGTVAFVVNDPTGEEKFIRAKGCLDGFVLSDAQTSVSQVDQSELNDAKNIINSVVQSIPNSVPSIQIVSQEEAETTISIYTKLKKEIEWRTYKTNNAELLYFGACNSGDYPVARLSIEVLMDVQKNGQSVQKVNKSADGYKNMEYGQDCYFNLEPGQVEEPNIIPVCQTRQQMSGGAGYRKVSINFDSWFNSLKQSIYPKILPAIGGAFMIMEENVPVTFYKIKKPEGVKEANGHLSNGNWSEAKEIYENLISSLSSTPDLNPEDEAKFYHNYAITLMAEGDFEKAMEWLVKAKGLVDTDRHDRAIETLKYLIENEKKLNEQK